MRKIDVEWPTICLIAGTYGLWILLSFYGQSLNPMLWIMLSGIVVTFFMSLTHEVVHGHPTRNSILNRLLLLVPIGWLIPFERFRETHIEHHETGDLTDPFDDPESWYLPTGNWTRLSIPLKKALEFNNTLFGRMLIGPVINMIRFYAGEMNLLISKPEKRQYLIRVWGLHLVLCMLMIFMLATLGSVPVWQHAAAVYLGYSLLLVRTFLEHQAAPDQSERTVIIERSCPMAFLFLFNNLHVVHHSYPGVPWYRLPRFYREKREEFIRQNRGYIYGSYAEIFHKYFFKMKEPVSHPIVHNDV